MSYYLSKYFQWTPSIFYGFGAIYQFIGPTLNRKRDGETQSLIFFLPDLYDKVKDLSKNIFIYRVEKFDPAANVGTSICANIYCDNDFFSLDPNLLNFNLKHEASHIYHNDNLLTSGAAFLASTVAAFAVPYLKSCVVSRSPWWAATPTSIAMAAIPSYAGFLTRKAFIKHTEYRADNFALTNSTPEELLAGKRMFSTFVELNKELSKKYPQLFNSEGNFISLVNDHPPYTERLKMIQDELEKRHIGDEQNTLEKSEKDQEMRDYLLNFYQTQGIKLED
ncbi:MAG: M48 family metalloprotease [Parachlamydiales bacterium]|jgi:hypothetical protein